MEINFWCSWMGRKRKYSSQFKNLSSVSEDVFTGQWLAGQQTGAAAATQTCSRRKQVIQNSNTVFQLWAVLWCVTCTSQLTQLSQTAFSGSPSCQMSHSLIDIRNLNGLVLWKLIVLNKIRPSHFGTEIFQNANCVLLSAVSLCPKCAVLVLLLTSKIPRV